MTIYLVCGGQADLDFIKTILHEYPCDYMIAVDSGLETLFKLSLTPDCIVGDFDSVDLSILKEYLKDPSIRIERHKPEKSKTDTELAMDTAVALKPQRIILLGASGTRLDHTMSNIGNLLIPFREGIESFMIDRHNKVMLIDRGRTIKKEEAFGSYLSLLPLTETVTGITLRGFKYPLTNTTLTHGSSLCISNEMLSDADIALESGILICIEAKD